jgi:DNA repair exonuclease SbcCD ATPase subunit
MWPVLSRTGTIKLGESYRPLRETGGAMASGPQNNPAEAGLKAVQDAVGGAVAAQQRSVGLAQDWAESLIETYRSQAESYRALTDAMRSSMTALEKTLQSQEETNRALKESLDAYRNVVESASETQERNMQFVQNFFDNIVETLRSQLESSRSLLLEPAAKQQELFQSLTQEWMDAYTRLLNAPLEFYRASTGRGEGEGDEG